MQHLVAALKNKKCEITFPFYLACRICNNSPALACLTDASRCSVQSAGCVCAHVCVCGRVCINLLSFLILQSYRKIWQAQMSRRGNYHSSNKCGSVCDNVCMFVFVCVCLWVGVFAGWGPEGGCWWWDHLQLADEKPCCSPHRPFLLVCLLVKHSHSHTYWGTCN